MDQLELDKLTTFKSVIEKYEKGEITVDELSGIVIKLGGKITFWDKKSQPNPKYIDNEQSRVGFKYDPYQHLKGKYYQSVIKRVIRGAIDIVHSHTLKKYDENQFIYDDPRLIELDSFAKAYISNNFKDAEYKEDFMNKLIDIVHGTIAKEDIYYRSVYFDFINQLIKVYPNGFELTKEEKENLNTWHKVGHG